MQKIVHISSILIASTSVLLIISLGVNLDVARAIMVVGISLTFAILAVATKEK